MTIRELEKAALKAGRRGESWSSFWREHADAIRALEPYCRERFHKLRSRLLHMCLTADDAGQFAIGDDDGLCPWERDDQPTCPHDTFTQARINWSSIGTPSPAGDER
jgi:hypothetical protein